MSIEYRGEIKLGYRLIILAAVPFLAFLGIVLTHLFGVLGPETRELVVSLLLGDFTRFGDFIGFLAVFLCAVVIPIIMVIVASYTALLLPNHVTNIDADRRIVTCAFDLPWRQSYRRSYGFDELCIKMIHYDEGNRIKLSLPDRWVALTLISELSYSVTEQKFRRLVEIGLPNK